MEQSIRPAPGSNRRMWENKWVRLLALLVVANIAYYLYNNWGLVTVKVTDAPLRDVIRSIEWQTWVKIYSNIPGDAKVTMYCDHVPFSEAMETLAVNVELPPSDDDNARQRRPRNPDGSTNTASATPPPPSTNAPAGAPPGGPGGPGLGGFRGGGFSRASWNLAFFTGGSKAQVQQEIREFQSNDPNEENKVYSASNQIQMISTENMISPNPLKQAWPGMQAVSHPSGDVPPNMMPGAAPKTDAPPPGPPTVHTYFDAFTQSANIWIMAPGSWTPQVSQPPPENSSIISAVEKLVSKSGGYVTRAYILRSGRGGSPGTRAVAINDDAWADRMRNVINGLPADQKEEATDNLNKEIDYRKGIAALPPEERRKKMFEHGLERMLYGERLSRMSPEKRAQAYKRMIAIRNPGKVAK